MLGLKWNWGRRVRFETPQPPAPEPLYERERPMTGFFATLSPEQRAKVRAYKDEDNLGGNEFRRRA